VVQITDRGRVLVRWVAQQRSNCYIETPWVGGRSSDTNRGESDPVRSDEPDYWSR